MGFSAIARKLVGGKKKGSEEVPSASLPQVQPQHLLAALERVGGSSTEELTRTRRSSFADDATASTSSTTSEANMDPQAILKLLEQHGGSRGGDDKYLQMIEAMQMCQYDEDDDDDYSLSDSQKIPGIISF